MLSFKQACRSHWWAVSLAGSRCWKGCGRGTHQLATRWGGRDPVLGRQGTLRCFAPRLGSRCRGLRWRHQRGYAGSHHGRRFLRCRCIRQQLTLLRASFGGRPLPPLYCPPAYCRGRLTCRALLDLLACSKQGSRLCWHCGGLHSRHLGWLLARGGLLLPRIAGPLPLTTRQAGGQQVLPGWLALLG